MKLPAIVIAGTNSGCGKTTLSMGLMAALTEKGIVVQPYKVGPDFIDPMYHTKITGRASRNLDSWLLGQDTLRHLYAKNLVGADIAVVEGVMGYYDGYGGTSMEGSTADVAGILGLPVILVINGAAMSLSAAALVKGFAEFDQEASIKGVIINHVSGESHYRILKEAIEGHTGIPVLGYLEHTEELTIGSRHLGLVTAGEQKGLTEKIGRLVACIRETVDLEQLMKIAGQARMATGQGLMKTPVGLGKNITRIAVAMDEAFCFYYRDALDLLEMAGAALVPFSPLRDHKLPENTQGLYIGGGYPEVWAGELTENAAMRADIRHHVQIGIPAYAECGGLMYMTDSIRTSDGQDHRMIGLLPGRSIMTASLKRFGYVHVEMTRDTLLAKKGETIRAHEFHYSETEAAPDVTTCMEISRRRGEAVVKSWRCGFKRYHMLAGYPHMHFWSNPIFASNFVASCKVYGDMKRDGNPT